MFLLLLTACSIDEKNNKVESSERELQSSTGNNEIEEIVTTSQEEKLPIEDTVILLNEYEEKNITQPKIKLEGKELEKYMSYIFLVLVRNPETIGNYEKVFTMDSIELFEKMDWYYAEPDKFYDWASSSISTGGEESKKSTILSGEVVVDSQYPASGMDLQNLPKRKDEEISKYLEMEKKIGLGKWGFSVDWKYDKNTGIIEIRDIYLYLSYY